MDVTTLLVVIGDVCLKIGNPVQAEPLLKEALETRRQLLPLSHVQLGNVERLWGSFSCRDESLR